MYSILVVEDEAIAALDLSKRLERIGYLVPNIASSGEDAVRLAGIAQPDLILMNVRLKGSMNGIAAASEIIKYHHIPIIFLAASSDQKNFKQAKLCMPYAYLTKPVITRDLQVAVELALYKHASELKILNGDRKYRALMSITTSGIIIYDKNGVILEANEQAALIFGCGVKEVINKSFGYFFEECDKNYNALKLQKLLIEKKTDISISQITQMNGEKRDVEISSTCVQCNSEYLVVAMLNDITDKNRLQEQVMLNDKLATIGTLATSVIHEINNPLSWVLYNLTALKGDLEHASLETPEEGRLVKELIDHALEGAAKIKTIVHDLKSFGRLDEDEFKPCIIEDIILKSVSMISPQFKKSVNFETQIDENIPTLLLNESKLHQVIVNLIMNAAQSFDEKLKRQKNIVQIFAKLDNGNLVIQIIDNGCGIKEESLPHIFDPFFTTKPVGIGTGLGLPICKDIINALNGEITVVSEFGVGSTFTINVPIRITLPEINQRIDLSNFAFTNKNILLIDDDKNCLSMIRHFTDHDNKIVSVNSGKEAINLLNTDGKLFDVIICDLNMPDINGADIYRFLKNIDSTAKDKIIFMTGGIYDDNTNKFIKSINNQCLEKPFTPSELMEGIYKVVNS